jgi:hypothetical protein
MKTVIFMLACLSVILTACKKNSEVLNKLNLNGIWELRATKGGNIIPAIYPPGNGHLISFGNTNFATYVAGVLVGKGNYQQHNDGMGHDTLIFSNNNYAGGVWNKNIATIQSDTLYIQPLFPDIAASLYVKTSNMVSLN